jgi:hypothetical protein
MVLLYQSMDSGATTQIEAALYCSDTFYEERRSSLIKYFRTNLSPKAFEVRMVKAGCLSIGQLLLPRKKNNI